MTTERTAHKIKGLRLAAKAAREWRVADHGECSSNYYHGGFKPFGFSASSIPIQAEHG